MRLGYRPRDGNTDQYERGTLLGSWISFSPQNWRSRATLQVRTTGPDRTNVRLELDVNTSGQIVTPEEQAWWEAEADGLRDGIVTGEFGAAELSAAVEEIGSRGKGLLTGQVLSTILGALLTVGSAFLLSRCSF